MRVMYRPVDSLVFKTVCQYLKHTARVTRVGRNPDRGRFRLRAAAGETRILGFVGADVNGAEADAGIAVEIGEDAKSIYYEVVACVHCGGAGEKAKIVVGDVSKKRVNIGYDVVAKNWVKISNGRVQIQLESSNYQVFLSLYC